MPVGFAITFEYFSTVNTLFFNDAALAGFVEPFETTAECPDIYWTADSFTTTNIGWKFCISDPTANAIAKPAAAPNLGGADVLDDTEAGAGGSGVAAARELLGVGRYVQQLVQLS